MSKMGRLAYDIENLTPANFKQKYGMSPEAARKKYTLKDDEDCGCDSDVNEAAEEMTGAALVDHLTTICMQAWYQITSRRSICGR